MKCPQCAQEAGSGRFCRNCGAAVVAGVASAQAESVCPSCGATVRPDAKFCGSCATPLGTAPAPPVVVAASVICVNCGTENKAETKFCKSCGKAVGSGTPAAPPRLGVSPDMMPTAMMDSPVRPAPSPAPAMAEPARAPRPAPPPVPRAEAPAPPKLVPRSAPVVAPPVPPTQGAGGANKSLLVASIVVFSLVAAGLLYRFVLRKPPATQTVQTTPAAEAPATTEGTPDAANPDAQMASTTGDSQPTTDATQPASVPPPPGSSAAGNTAGTTTGVATPRTPKRPPAKPTGPGFTQAHANAEQALAAGQLLNPPDSSALFWARKAKSLGDPGAAQIEQQVYSTALADVTSAWQGHNYDGAQAQLYQLASSFPEHTELRSMQDEIHQEQQRYAHQMEEQRRQTELAAQIKKFPAQHRHGTGESFCTGTITTTPDGVGHYDCNTADSKGRCEHVTFGPDSLKEVKIRGDGSLHVATRQQGNFDFTGGDFAMRGSAAALTPLVKH
jgi:hypothetical protein